MLPDIPQFTVAKQVDPAESSTLQFIFEWNLVPGGGTNLYRDGVRIAENLSGLSTGDTDIEYNRQYIYRIAATDSEIESGLSVPVILTATPIGLPFATAAELAIYWRTLTAEEITRAESLLLIASNRLRSYDSGNDPSIDTRSNTDPTFRTILNWITMEAVKRAMMTPAGDPSIESRSMTAGVYSENIKFTNPTGDLFFRKTELAALGLEGSQKLGSISPISQYDLYAEGGEES